MMAAIQAARTGASVVIADGNEKAGKKLYATGNGRCNLTNRRCAPDAYNRPEDGFTEAVLEKFGPEDTVAFFRELGLLIREEQEGRCYPYSGQAASVVAFLEREMVRLGVAFLHSDRVIAAERREVSGVEEYPASGVKPPAEELRDISGAEKAAASGLEPAAAIHRKVSSAREAAMKSAGRTLPVSSAESPAADAEPAAAIRRKVSGARKAAASGLEPAEAIHRKVSSAGKAAEDDTEQEDSRTNGLFFSTTESGRTIVSRTLIIACGGKAGPAFGSTGDGYGLARGFGHTLQAPRPALVGCLSSDPAVRALRGRARAAVSLYENGRLLVRDRGEIQFTGTGISGICVMDLTRFMEAPRPAGKKKKKSGVHTTRTVSVSENAGSGQPSAAERTLTASGRTQPAAERTLLTAGRTQSTAEKTLLIAEDSSRKQYEIGIDFAPELTEEDVRNFLIAAAERGRRQADWTAALSGLLNSHTAEVLAGRCDDIDDAVRMVKNFRVPVESTQGWKEAQVTCGGVRRNEIWRDTLESTLIPGVFFCGEVLDVDGRCGGYNLQWAWSSGAVSGRSAAEFIADNFPGLR